MNLIFFSLVDLFKSYFNDNFSGLEKIFESNFLVESWIDFQQSVGVLSGSDMVIASAPIVLLAAGITIFLGVAGEAFFKRTGIPDIAFLMVLGVIIGPVLGIIQPEVVVEVVPYFAAIALIIMMFDGGLNMDIRHVAKTAHFSLLLALLSFVMSVIIVMLFAHYGLGWEWLDSILLGSMVGGSSSVIVFGLVRNFRQIINQDVLLGLCSDF